MNRRNAIKVLSLGTASLFTAPWPVPGRASTFPDSGGERYPFRLPDLPLPYDAWDAFIDPETMEIHHRRHHGAYVANLNKAMESYPEWQDVTLNGLLTRLGELPEDIRTTVRNNGGGHANHHLFWNLLSPTGGTRPEGALAEMIERDFGSVEDCLEALRKAALGVFGSGWAWLSLDDGRLLVESTPNQDSPVMAGRTPLVGIDVWEHAYYLRYQNRRADYVTAVLDHIDWQTAAGAMP